MGNDIKTCKRVFLKHFDEKLKSQRFDGSANLTVQIAELAEKIEKEQKSWIVDEQSEFHLCLTSLALASYNILRPEICDDEKVLDLIKSALMEPGKSKIQSEMRGWMKKCKNPFRDMVAHSKRMENSYGKTFEFSHPKDDDMTFYQNITKCFFNDFLRYMGAPELVPVFCKWDYAWMDIFKNGEFGFVVSRPTSLGFGDDKCRFQFIRDEFFKDPTFWIGMLA